MNWGYRIVVAYLLFMGILGVLAVKSFRSKVNLVAPDYYRQELAYQQQIDKIANAASLKQPVTIEVLDEIHTLTITFPASHLGLTGQVTLYRPSNAALDRIWKLAPNNENQQLIPLQELANGLWKVKVEWQVKDKSYYQQKNIYVP